MLRSLLGFDWKKSSAHLLLLSKFLSPRNVEDLSKSDAWEAALREAPEKTIKRFAKEGMIESASLAGLLDYRYKASDLKKMLKQRGLPVSGRKADLIARLVQEDVKGMRKATQGLAVLQCSEQGRVIAEQYLAREKEERARIEHQVLRALQEREFREASQLVASFEAEQVFPRGFNIDWKNYDPTHDVAMLHTMFKSKPKILALLSGEQLDQLRVAAGMMHLWGKNTPREWLPPDSATMLTMDNDVVARMIVSHASHQISVSQYHKAGVKMVEIRTANDRFVCNACRDLAAKEYRLNQVPELPYEKCTSEIGCRCWTVAVGF